MSSSQAPAPDTRHRQYRFGDFTLDLDSGFLSRGNAQVSLRPKAFDALVYLVERHGRLVTKAELIEALWPDTAVTDNSLAHCLAEIRRSLGDRSQQVIRTVARRGYVFAAPVGTPVLEFEDNLREPLERPVVLPVSASPTGPYRHRWKAAGAAVAALAVAAAGMFLVRSTTPGRSTIIFEQLTDLADSAVAPSVSPDGRMLAFIRGNNPFISAHSADQIYVKMLPKGEPVQLTHDPRPKYSVAFSPDASRIAYTAYVAATGGEWNTYVLSPLGGEPRLLLANAAGLTWLDEHRLLFSEIRKGMHMGIVSATENRSEHREVYFPTHERAMAHYSYASPDRRSALVVEMDYRALWQPCRVVVLKDKSPGRQVGPQGACTSAGWSPDGRWMYFSVTVDKESHLWRQRFPNGEPEQLTFGPTEEDGIAVTPDGSIITSVGTQRSAVWIHDADGDRPLSSEGRVDASVYTGRPSYSSDARRLYYLRRESPDSITELWQTDLESGISEPVLPGISVLEYDISRDGNEVVFTTQPSGKPSQLWVAPLDRSASPRQIASNGETSPHFDSSGQLLFRLSDDRFNYLARMHKDGSGRTKVVAYPINTIQNVSPDRRWVVAITPLSGTGESSASMAVPAGGGSPRRICAAVCGSAWSPDGRFLYVQTQLTSRTSLGQMIAIPVRPETGLPDLPEGGVQPGTQAPTIRESRVVERADIVPGVEAGTYAYVKSTVHRNLFRVTVP